MSPYEVLGINEKSSFKEIRKAYREKCFEFKDSSDQLRLIIDAYETLTDKSFEKVSSTLKEHSLDKIVLNISLEDLLTKSSVIYNIHKYNIEIPLPGYFVKEYEISVNENVTNVYINLINKEYKGCSFLFDKNLLLGFTVLNKSIIINKHQYNLRKDKQSLFFEDPKLIYNFAENREELCFPTEVDLKNKVIYFNEKGIKYLHPLTNKIHNSDLLIAYTLK